jgi:serine/threonine protein kinase
MATVWRAVHPETRVQAAIKVLTGEAGQADGPMRALRREARAVARLNHPGVVQVLDTGVVGHGAPDELVPGSPWLAMEYASGGTLNEADPLPWPDLRAVLLGILDALAHAHARGLVHRDLKPGNVLLCTERDLRPGLKLSDFGIATAIDWHVRSGSLAVVAGTLHYIAPEQLLGNARDYGPWTDLYALGNLTWKLTTGQLPFSGRKGPTLMRAQLLEEPPAFLPLMPVPDGLEPWLRRCLEKAPRDRFRFAADAARALAALEPPEMTLDTGLRRFVLSREGRRDLEGVELPAPSAETEVRTATLSGIEAPSTAIPRPSKGRATASRVPVPRTWRRHTVPTPPPRLVGAGRGLVGMRQVPLVGREKARDRLWSVLVAMEEAERPRLVVLRGAPGVGKSRLAEWLVTRTAELGLCQSLRGVFRPGEAVPVTVRRMVARALGTRHLEREEVLERLEERFEDPSGDWLGKVADWLVDPRPSRASFPILVEVLDRLTAERPLVLWLEDTHATGSRDVQKFTSFLQARSRAPILVLATQLHPLPADSSRKPVSMAWTHADEVLTLGPLRNRHIAEIVRKLLPLERSLVQDLCRRVGGNPRFALGVVEGWVERDLLKLTPRGYRLDGPITDAGELASAVDDRIAALLRGLPAPAGPALERLAVVGMPIARADWVALGAREEVVDVLSERLVRDGHLVMGASLDDDSDLIELEGGMLREALVQRATAGGRRAGHHRAVADWLLAGGARARRTSALAIGDHLVAAGRVARARRVWLDGAWRALADERVEQLRSLVDRLAMDGSPDPGDVLAFLDASADWLAGDLTRAYETTGPLFTRMSRQAEPTHPELAAQVALLHARVLAEQGELARAGRVLAELVAQRATLERAGLASAVDDLSGLVALWDRRFPLPVDASPALQKIAQLHGSTPDRALLDEVERTIGSLDGPRRWAARLWVEAAEALGSDDSLRAEAWLGRAIALQDGIEPVLAAPTRVQLALRLMGRQQFEQAQRQAGLARHGSLGSADRVAIDAVELAACAEAGRWPAFDLALRAVARGLGTSLGPSRVPAVAEALERSGVLAAAARLRDRAANAFRLARGLYRQAGDQRGERRVDEHIRALRPKS